MSLYDLEIEEKDNLGFVFKGKTKIKSQFKRISST